MREYRYDIAAIRRRQAEQGLDNNGLAKRAGVHPTTVTSVLTGKTAKPPTVKKIAEALGIELADIVVEIDADGLQAEAVA